MGGVSRTNHAVCGETASDKTHCARRQLRPSVVPVVDAVGVDAAAARITVAGGMAGVGAAELDAMTAVVAGAASSLSESEVDDDAPPEERARLATGPGDVPPCSAASSSRSSALARSLSTALMRPSMRLWDDCGR